MEKKEIKRLNLLKDYMTACMVYYRTYNVKNLRLINDLKFILADKYNMDLNELSNIEFYSMLQVRDLKDL